MDAQRRHRAAGDEHGCEEYRRLSRRGFLAASGAAAIAAAAPAWLPRVTFARSYRSGQRDVIISIFLRGAADSLTMIVPHQDPDYYLQRPTLAVPRPSSGLPNRATNLDGFFGLPPAMMPLMPAYASGRLLLIQACGMPRANRSHFDAQRFMEVGRDDDPALTTGWLGRHIASTPPMDPEASLRAVGINAGLTRTLVGAPRTLPIADLDAFAISGPYGSRIARRFVLQDMYANTGDATHAAAATTLQTMDMLDAINFASYTPSGGAVYGPSGFETSLRSVAALLKAQVGVEAVAIDLHGWDTHSNQGNDTGQMGTMMTYLARGLAALNQDLSSGDVRPSFIVTVLSEFGRRVQENGSSGTDHGYGGCMLVLGSAVVGGRVLCQWPGLSAAQRYQGLDLAITTDYRDILAEIVDRRLGNPDVRGVFPGFTPTYRGVVS